MQSRQTRFLPKALSVELRRLPWRILGGSLIAVAALCWLALVSWSFADPSFNYAAIKEPRNWLGLRGAGVADFLIGAFGLAAPLLVIPVAALGFQIASGYTPLRPRRRALFWALAAVALPAFFSTFATPKTWLPSTGLGGFIGDAVVARAGRLLPGLPGGLLWLVLAAIFAFPGAWLFWKACGLTLNDFALAFGIDNSNAAPTFRLEDRLYDTAERVAAERRATSWVRFFSPRNRALVPRPPREFWMTQAKAGPSLPPAKVPPSGRADLLASERPDESGKLGFASWGNHVQSPDGPRAGPSGQSQRREEPPREQADETVFGREERIEPFFGPAPRSMSSRPTGGGDSGAGPSDFKRLTGNAIRAASNGAQDLINKLAQGAARSPLIYTKARPGTDPEPDAASWRHIPHGFALPPLSLLVPPPRPLRARSAFDAATMQRASALMGLLGDFGVRGKITAIYPGPVVTLFELEPARGTKSSRVIGLADDVARAMGTASARIASIPGRDALGIELPNLERETVLLRDVFESEAFQESQTVLSLALGKSVGGEPIVAGLDRMPHLLMAGTAGSGLSGGIHAMILSVLFKLPPSHCNFMMIDGEKLELSAYDGIPHLIAPVMTGPEKAFLALKWALDEMNERYERINRLGVRNIGGFNAKVPAMMLRGERSAFDGESSGLAPMPYLVILIGEMADLMMSAGKDAEFAVQRLSELARGAGIHLIMATRRPGASAITSAIKASFPSRICYQVTSKVDSRTVLGEHGAEQLLGDGDMLYMAAGGRIIRAHAPLVSGAEVEAVTQYLKRTGGARYRGVSPNERFDHGSPPAWPEGLSGA